MPHLVGELDERLAERVGVLGDDIEARFCGASPALDRGEIPRAQDSLKAKTQEGDRLIDCPLQLNRVFAGEIGGIDPGREVGHTDLELMFTLPLVDATRGSEARGIGVKGEY